MRFVRVLIGVVFGLTFSGIGGFIALETAVPTYVRWQETKAWDATQGEIIAVGGENSGVTASFRYQVGGKEHLGERVHLADFKDNIGSYHADMRRFLTEKQRTGQRVTVWFNPDNPADAIIDREMRWGLFTLMTGFCSVFIVVGLAVAIASVRGRNNRRDSTQLSLAQIRQSWKDAQAHGENGGGFIGHMKSSLQEHPGSGTEYSDPSLQPWLKNPRWQTRHIRSNARRGMYSIWFFAILWNTLGFPLVFLLGDELAQQNYAALSALLFPLVGIFLLKKAWNRTREWRRFGVIEVEMDPFPGAIGGHVGGRFLIKGSFNNGHQYSVELACVHSYVSGSGKNRSRRENILWSEVGFAQPSMMTTDSGTGTGLSFRFSIPDNLPESAVKQSGDYHLWRIKLSADIPGVNLDRDYNIPVFRTKDRSSSIQHDLSEQAAKARAKTADVSRMALSAGQLDQTALARSVRFSERGGVSRFYYPMFRNKALTLLALFFAASFCFATYWILTEFGGGALWFVVIPFSLPFAIIGLVSAIAAIYLPLNNLRVVIGNGAVEVTRRLFIFPISRHQLASYDVTQLEVARSGSTGPGRNRVVHFKIRAHTKDKKRITIAEDVDGEDLAGAYKGFLESRLGIASSTSR